MNSAQVTAWKYAVCTVIEKQTVFVVKGRLIDAIEYGGVRLQVEDGLEVEGCNELMMARENVCDTLGEAMVQARKMAQKYGTRNVIIKEKM